MSLKPCLDILPTAQKTLWPHLKDIPSYFVLYGGTALALRYGHRQSIDFDFFTSKHNIDLKNIASSLSFIKNNPHLIHKLSDNHVDINIKLESGNVKLTLLNDKDIISGTVKQYDKVSENRINIASPLDLMAAKILALHNRTEVKDFIDLAECICNNISLQSGFEAAFAISKLSRHGESRLMLDRLVADLQSKSVYKIITSGHIDISAEKMATYAEVLKASAQQIDLQKVRNTRLKAEKTIEFNQGIGM